MLGSLLSLVSLLPQSPGGDESAPQGLTVVVVNVGQGDGLLLKPPDGKVHAFDAGPDGEGSAAMKPAIQALAPTGYGVTFLSHWHIDHYGGFDEILGAYPFTDCYDRGDVNRASSPDITAYLSVVGARRRALLSGQVIQLGGGVAVTVIAQNGQVKGGTNVPVNGANQEENARSIALRVDYGSFSLWLGGDLTGGGNSGGLTPDVETPATVACGNVDVYHVNHHGSITSTSTALVSNLAPELAVVSCGSNNPYGHPSTTAINRINQAAAARALVSTTAGTGMVGFGVGGTITITTDGRRYRASASNGRFLDFFCDEYVTPAPLAGELRISEIQRQPALASEALGEYVEITNVGKAPVALKNVKLQSSGGVFTIVTNLAAYPGRPIVLQAHGDPATNGGVPFGFVWPYQALTLANASDTLGLQLGATTLDTVSYTTGFPGGPGVAAERKNLLVAASAATFAAATGTYGGGGKGTPGARNPGDVSPYVAQMKVDTAPGEVVFRATDLAHGGRLGIVGVSFGSSPGFPFLSAQIPLNPDLLFTTLLGLPEYVLALPVEGYRSLRLPLPSPNPLQGYPAYAAHIVLDLAVPSVVGLSNAVPFVFP